jgi:hypothetical protein
MVSGVRSERSAARGAETVVRSDSVEPGLIALLVEDEVLRELGIEVQTTATSSTVSGSGHRLLLSWGPPYVGAEVAIQQLTLRVRQVGGGDCVEDFADAVLQRAVAVLTERATRRGLPVMRVAPQHFGPHECVLCVLYRLSADAA